jgi:hypothetical protein
VTFAFNPLDFLAVLFENNRGETLNAVLKPNLARLLFLNMNILHLPLGIIPCRPHDLTMRASDHIEEDNGRAPRHLYGYLENGVYHQPRTKQRSDMVGTIGKDRGDSQVPDTG